jgi:hypothetical protein
LGGYEVLNFVFISIKMRKEGLFTLRERIAQRRPVSGEMPIYLMPAVLAKGGLMKMLGENSLQPAKKSHNYYTRPRQIYKSKAIIFGQLQRRDCKAGAPE